MAVLNFMPNNEDAKSYALKYASIGWHVFPLWWIENEKCACGEKNCKSAGKHPIGKLAPKGQDDATVNKDTIIKWWSQTPKANIGVYLAPSKLVAIDIDPRNGGHETIEMLEDKHGAIFSDVTQYTGGGGEHRVFSVPSSISLPGTLGKGVDVKANGYIVVEPSNHIKGVYEWEGSSAPYDGNVPSPLPDWIRDMAIIRNAQQDKQPFASRLITDSQIKDLRDALLFVDADDRDTWIRTGLALKTIGAAGFNLFIEYSERSPKFNYGDACRVWRSFKPTDKNIESIFYDAKKSGWQPSIKTVSITEIEPFLLSVTSDKTIRSLPGIAGIIESYYNATAKVPQPMFAQQCALGLLSVLMGRRFKTEYDHYTSLYFLNIAGSAKGKEHIKRVTENVLKACDMSHLLAGDGYTSSGAVISVLTEKPVHISVIDELGLYLKVALDKNNSNQKTANTMLMECIGRLDGEVRSKNYSTQSTQKKDISKTILHPAITIQSMTTPSTFYDVLTADMIKDGFFGRFITHHSKMPRVSPRNIKPIPVFSEIIDWVNALNSSLPDPNNLFFTNAEVIATQAILSITPDAERILSEFAVEMVEWMNSLESSGLDSVIGRYAEFAWRLALMLAKSIDVYTNCIMKEAANHAVDYMRDRANEMVDECQQNLNGSEYQKIKNDVLDAIRLAGVEGVTERDMHRKAPFSRYKERELADVVKALVKAELIALTNTREGKPGKPRMAFIAITPNELAN